MNTIDNNIILTEEFSFNSSNGKDIIHGIMWKPIGKINAILQISHGMAEYIERYDEFARYLAKNGILVVGNDHIGHGKSIKSKENLGYFAEKNSSGRDASYMVVKDLRYITKIMKEQFRGVPYFMLGHSMGSFLARRYIMTYGKELDGVIIMGTGNQPGLLVSLGKLINGLIALVKGEHYRSRLIYKIIFGAYNNRIVSPESPNSWISANKENVKQYDKDEMCGFMFTVNGIDTLLSTLSFIEEKQNIRKIPQTLPVLLLSGEDDPVGGYSNGVKKVYRIYTRAGIKKIFMKFYKGCRHEILNENNRTEVYLDVLKWIQNTISEKNNFKNSK